MSNMRNSSEKVISPEILNTLGIYELRELARSIGVSSPTTKKREQLCTEILDISSGAVKVEAKQNKKGRPPKTITKITTMVKDYIPPEILKLQKPIERESYSNILMLAQNPSIYGQINSNVNKQIFGYLDSINGHFYLNNLKNNELFKFITFYVPDEIISKYNLREGDKVLAYGKISDNYDCGILEEVLKINDVDVSNWNSKRKVYDISAFDIPSVDTVVFGKNIKKGERTISYFQNDEDAILAIVKEIENLSRNNNLDEKLVFVGIELAPEVIYYGRLNKNLEMFATTYYNNLDESYNAIINAINFCNSTLKDGKSVRMFIFDIMGLVTRLDQHFASQMASYMGHNISGVQLVKKLVGMGKAISKDLTITTHSVAFESQRNDEFIVNEINKIAKTV